MNQLAAALDWILPLLKGKDIPFYVTGGFAAHLYGATRPVNDIDIDLPMRSIDSCIDSMRSFVESSPHRYKDSTWNIYGATLNFDGQLIDVTTDAEPRVHNKLTGEWDPLEMNFDHIVWIHAYGHDIPVQNPHDLMSYKSKIAYDEAKHVADVAAVERYLTHYSK